MQFASTMLIAAFHFPGWWRTPCGAEKASRWNSGAGKQRENQEYSRNTKKKSPKAHFLCKIICSVTAWILPVVLRAMQVNSWQHHTTLLIESKIREANSEALRDSETDHKRVFGTWKGDRVIILLGQALLRAVTNHLWNVKSPSLSSNAHITWSLNLSDSNEIRVPGNFTFNKMLFCSVVLPDLVQFPTKRHKKYCIATKLNSKTVIVSAEVPKGCHQHQAACIYLLLLALLLLHVQSPPWANAVPRQVWQITCENLW